MARHRRSDLPQQVVDAGRRAKPVEIAGDGPECLVNSPPVEDRGHRRHLQAGTAEVVDLEAKPRHPIAVLQQRLVVACRELEDAAGNGTLDGAAPIAAEVERTWTAVRPAIEALAAGTDR